jgi:NAD(P)-dependent dehydrogenase (short-subunit alcohol dehydrogenase family)
MKEQTLMHSIDYRGELGVTGKVAVVTAAGRGIGRATALLLAHWGAVVVAVDRDAESLAMVVAEIAGSGGTAEAAAADVCDEAAVTALFADASRRHGRLDILVNAVGGGLPAALNAISADDWDRMFALNAKSGFLCSREAARHMRTGGRIINVASLAGVSTSVLQGAHYSSSKAALIGLTRHLARELGPGGITVNAIAPGTTLTERIRRQMTPEREEAIAARIPLRRLATPEDQASVILFLASSLSAYVTGVTLDVSGGYLLG